MAIYTHLVCIKGSHIPMGASLKLSLTETSHRMSCVSLWYVVFLLSINDYYYKRLYQECIIVTGTVAVKI